MDAESKRFSRAGQAFSRDEVELLLSGPTIPLVEAARILFDLKPAAAQAAARRGEIPTIKVGRKILCPTASLRRMLGISRTEQAA